MSKRFTSNDAAVQLVLVPVEVTEPSLIDSICRFRVQVWAATGCLAPDAFPNGIWRDELDDTCKHLVVMQGERILAAARWSLHRSVDELPEAKQYQRLHLQLEGPIGVVERVVACPSVPHLGLSRVLLDAIEAKLRAAGARYELGQASPSMVRLSLRRGRHIVGPAAPDPRFPGVEFQIMLIRL